MKPIDNGIVRIKFSHLPFSKAWITLIWREAQNWPRHHVVWDAVWAIGARPEEVPVLPAGTATPGVHRAGLASLAPLGFFVDGSYD